MLKKSTSPSRQKPPKKTRKMQKSARAGSSRSHRGGLRCGALRALALRASPPAGAASIRERIDAAAGVVFLFFAWLWAPGRLAGKPHPFARREKNRVLRWLAGGSRRTACRAGRVRLARPADCIPGPHNQPTRVAACAPSAGLSWDPRSSASGAAQIEPGAMQARGRNHSKQKSRRRNQRGNIKMSARRQTFFQSSGVPGKTPLCFSGTGGFCHLDGQIAFVDITQVAGA
jgi:hypothetical protein